MFCVELKESLKYFFKHAVIKMYFTADCEGYINLLDFFPILKNGKALNDTIIKMLHAYISCNLTNNQLLFNTFNKDISAKDVDSLVKLHAKQKIMPNMLVSKLYEEYQLIEHLEKTIHQEEIYIYTCKFHPLLINPYIKIMDHIRRGYAVCDLFKHIDIRRYDNAIYRYSKLISYSTANIKISNSILREIIRITWYEKQVIKTVIQSLIGKSSIPKDIHSHLLNYISH